MALFCGVLPLLGLGGCSALKVSQRLVRVSRVMQVIEGSWRNLGVPSAGQVPSYLRLGLCPRGYMRRGGRLKVFGGSSAGPEGSSTERPEGKFPGVPRVFKGGLGYVLGRVPSEFCRVQMGGKGRF